MFPFSISKRREGPGSSISTSPCPSFSKGRNPWPASVSRLTWNRLFSFWNNSPMSGFWPRTCGGRVPADPVASRVREVLYWNQYHESLIGQEQVERLYFLPCRNKTKNPRTTRVSSPRPLTIPRNGRTV